MSAVGQDGGTSAGMSQTSITLVAEACTAVALQWRFEFDDDFLDPAKYLRVRVSKADGSIVEEGLLPDSSIFVDEPEDETYTVLAVATVGGEECGRAQGTITITALRRIASVRPHSTASKLW